MSGNGPTRQMLDNDQHVLLFRLGPWQRPTISIENVSNKEVIGYGSVVWYFGIATAF